MFKGVSKMFNMFKRRWFGLAVGFTFVGVCAAAAAGGGDGGGGHEDVFAPVLLELAMVVLLAMAGRAVAVRLKQPPVLGELIAGIVMGNIGYHLFQARFFSVIMHLTDLQAIFNAIWGTTASTADIVRTVFSPAQMAPGMAGDRMLAIVNSPQAAEYIVLGTALWIFSNLGVILLLFVVGYEMQIGELIKVGPRATLVAVVGVITPFVLGFVGSALLLPALGHNVHIFMGAILCATSVGITARVFKDLNRLATPEATMILGAAVIDDVLGLIILAIVAGIVKTGAVEFMGIAKITLYSVLFLGLAMLIGEKVIGWMIRHMQRLAGRDLKLLFPLSLAFVMAWLASLIGLAPIVGAFTAGLVFSENLFQRHPEKRAALDWIEPVEAIFVPIFFVLMGMQVNLAAFMQPDVVLLALAFILAAILGKLVCGLAGGKGVDALTIGVGMIPRGEVGLIFASIGKSMHILTDAVFSGIVIVVVVTTLITPIGLKWTLGRMSRRG